MAFVIAGHHAGLANCLAQGDTRLTPLQRRVEDNLEELGRLGGIIPGNLSQHPLPCPPSYLAEASSRQLDQEGKCRLELWIRFLFSALVDADYLATEEFYEPDRRRLVRGFDPISELRQRLDRHVERFTQDTDVNRRRAEVLSACRAAAEWEPGRFSLTVPTGGGKTLSSMAFALSHAERHGLRRVIVVIPYTSIIEQNARVYREVFGDGNVIEHHSAVDEDRRMEESSELELRRRLAAENWDAPIIVTTNVQFFESLFANRPSRCRKLHNIARSVVILDEAQSLPPQYLTCMLGVMRELTTTYGCSLLLMTATQPALHRREGFPQGLDGVREIVPNREELARSLKRVAVSWPEPRGGATPYQELGARLAAEDRVLAIVHLRRDARRLARLLPRAHRYHLSALQCAAHRAAVLDKVRAALAAGEPCRLVATQLVEAGVDIDFPVVYRALAGLDSVAQAGGRCNREGRLRDREGNAAFGRVHVFRAETDPPPGLLRMALETTEALLARYGPQLELSDGRLMDEYFRMLYGKGNPDREQVQPERAALNFATVADRVQLIEDGYTRPVVVPWGDAPRRIEAFRRTPSRSSERALQPYVVQIPEWELNEFRQRGALERLHDRVDVIAEGFRHLYDDEFGLVLHDGERFAVPAAFVV